MKQETPNTKIASFWKWFVENEARIKEVVDSGLQDDRDALVNDLDNQILEFGMFTWEIGQAADQSFFLTISPNGNKERLELGRSIMKAAPRMPGWEFYPAKPAKDWDLHFSLFDNNVVEHQVDASGWKFVLMPDQGMVIIEAPNIAHLDFDTQVTAGDLVVTNIIGEERKITDLRGIEIVGKFEVQHKASGLPILDLKKHFNKF
jgi:hypothetical protein